MSSTETEKWCERVVQKSENQASTLSGNINDQTWYQVCLTPGEEDENLKADFPERFALAQKIFDDFKTDPKKREKCCYGEKKCLALLDEAKFKVSDRLKSPDYKKAAQLFFIIAS